MVWMLARFEPGTYDVALEPPPSDASCTVTETMAPVSMSTACSDLWAKCVRPSFIFAIFASGSCDDLHFTTDFNEWQIDNAVNKRNFWTPTAIYYQTW